MTSPALRAVDTPEWKAYRATLEGLQHGGGDGTSGGMNERITRVETHLEYAQRDLAEIKGMLGRVAGQLAELPTKGDLWSWKWQWTALAFAVVAIVIGGIIGGLAWIQPASTPVQPIVIQAPAAPIRP